MLFEAKIRRPGVLFDLWEGRGQKSGIVSGIQFVWNGTDYVAENNPLAPDDVAVLLPNPRVLVSVCTHPTGHAVALNPMVPDVDAAGAELAAKAATEPVEPVEPPKATPAAPAAPAAPAVPAAPAAEPAKPAATAPAAPAKSAGPTITKLSLNKTK